jgi:hypothetical protein
MRHAILALMLLTGFAGGRAEAQSATACSGRVAIDAIYLMGLGNHRFEYFLMLRNATPQRITVDVFFSGFPPDVTLFTSALPGVQLGPHETMTNLRFALGTNNNINRQTVRAVYDGPPGAGPSLRVTNCRAG